MAENTNNEMVGSYIYNVTTQISHQIHDAWVAWMKAKHIPEIMAKGCFTKFQFVRLLDIDESESVTYATQYYAHSKADYNRYVQIHAAALREDASKTWGNNAIGFRTLMQVLH